MRPRNILIALLSGTALAVGLWLALLRVEAPAAPRTATVLPTTMELPAFEMTRHDGETVDASVFEGQWDLVFFGFTHCPDICPITLKVLSDARDQLASAGHSPLPRIVLVSVDPERDTPERLAEYIEPFAAGTVGLTGRLDELRKLTAALGIFFQKRNSGDEFYSVDHSGVVLVIDPQGRFRALFSSPHKAENFVNDIPLLQAT